MRLLNKTKHSTSGLRIMLYDLAQKANISTRGVSVEVRRASRNLHGLCYPASKRIILWLLYTSRTDDIAYVWLHELAHTTNQNHKLYAAGHGQKGQRQADAVAERVTGITYQDIIWHKEDWHLEPTFLIYPTKAKAVEALEQRRYPFGKPRTDGFAYRLSPKSKRGKWRLAHKYSKTKDQRLN